MQSKATSSAALLETMMLVRAFEHQNAALAAAGHAPGTCTSVGQEAAAVGVVMGLGRQDLILTNHRSAGHLLARGADPGRVLSTKQSAGRLPRKCAGIAASSCSVKVS